MANLLTSNGKLLTKGQSILKDQVFNNSVLNLGLQFVGEANPSFLSLDASNYAIYAYDVRYGSGGAYNMYQSNASYRPLYSNGFLVSSSFSLNSTHPLGVIGTVFWVGKAISGGVQAPNYNKINALSVNYTNGDETGISFGDTQVGVSNIRSMNATWYYNKLTRNYVATANTAGQMTIIVVPTFNITINSYRYNNRINMGAPTSVANPIATVHAKCWGWYNRELTKTEIIDLIKRLANTYSITL